MQRISDDSSIFTAEAKAIDLALDFISTCDASNKLIIFSDSLSVLKAMNHTSSKNPQIQKHLEKCHELLAYKEIALCWIPSHIGIQGNEMVDKQAKTSLSFFFFFFFFFFFCFVALRPKSTAMVIAGRSVHLTTPFSWASLNKQLTSNRAHTFACN